MGRPRSNCNMQTLHQTIRTMIIEEGLVSVTSAGVAARLGVNKMTVHRLINGVPFQDICEQVVTEREKMGDLELSRAMENPRILAAAIGANRVVFGPTSPMRYWPFFAAARDACASRRTILSLGALAEVIPGFSRQVFAKIIGGAHRLPHVLRKLYPDDPALR